MNGRMIFSCALVPLLSGCAIYEGDGQFTDSGMGAAFDRYVLSLGELDLCNPNSNSFNIGRLPPENFSLYLKYCDKDLKQENWYNIQEKASPAIIHLLVKAKGKDVVYDGSLWETGHDRGGAYYQLGMNPNFQQYSGCVAWKFMSDKIGYEMGSNIFKIFMRHERKELVFNVVKPAPQNEKACKVKLSLAGGGWK